MGFGQPEETSGIALVAVAAGMQLASGSALVLGTLPRALGCSLPRLMTVGLGFAGRLRFPVSRVP